MSQVAKSKSADQAQLRQRAKELLSSKAVVMVVGFRKGSRGVAQPAFITEPGQADMLIFDETCGANLAAYLLKVKHHGRIGVVAKGCDSRSIVVLLQEKQLDRSQLHILGIGCEGVFENGRKADACTTCRFPNPVLYDELIGESKSADNEGAGSREQGEGVEGPSEFEKLSADESQSADKAQSKSAEQAQRWQRLSEDVSRCIRCYACRQVCPNCYCPVCFVDASMPSWVGKTTELSDTMLFHLMRALHMAGRCVECGACARACPMGIDLMRFNRKMARIVQERFGHVAGLKPAEAPPLAVFDPNDRQEFII